MQPNTVTYAEIYESRIPENCKFQTYDDHLDNVLLCLSVVRDVKKCLESENREEFKNPPSFKCGICEFNVPV
jgi:hypothetical protein